MRKIFLLGAILLCTLFSYAQDGVRIYANSSKDQAYHGVYLRKADVPDMFPKSYMVWLSEKPNGVESGYYGVQTGNGFLYNGSKDKIKLNKMEDAGNGWYYFDFGKDLYIRRIEFLSHLENIRLVPSGTKKSNSAKISAAATTSTLAVKEESIPKEVYVTPLDISQLKTPAFAKKGWSLAETTKEKDGATCELYVKEIDDEDVSIRYFKYPNGDFFTDSANHYMGDFMITHKKRVRIVRFNNHLYNLFPNGNYVYLGHWNGVSNSSHGMQKEVFQNHDEYDFNQKKNIYYRYPYRNKQGASHGDLHWEDGIDGYNIVRESKLESGGKLVIAGKTNKYSNKVQAYPSASHQFPIRSPRGDQEITGFEINDRLYVLDSLGNIAPCMQRIKDIWIYANRNDTIINVNVKDSMDNRYHSWEFIYKNGDRLKYVDNDGNWYYTWTLHRNGGIFKLKKGSNFVLTQPDGTTITYETFGEKIIQDEYYLGGVGMKRVKRGVAGFLPMDSLLLCDGTITFPNGRTEKYVSGFPESHWDLLREKANKAEEAKQKAELAKKRAPFIQKWGFYPGDYMTKNKWGQCIIPGRPFGAIAAFFQTSLIRNEGASKYYKVFTTGYIDKDEETGRLKEGGIYSSKDAYVWVRNGKITSVSWR